MIISVNVILAHKISLIYFSIWVKILHHAVNVCFKRCQVRDLAASRGEMKHCSSLMNNLDLFIYFFSLKVLLVLRIIQLDLLSLSRCQHVIFTTMKTLLGLTARRWDQARKIQLNCFFFNLEDIINYLNVWMMRICHVFS